MNFFVFPCEIQEINKRGGGVKISWGVSKNHEKINVPPVYFEPESSSFVFWRPWSWHIVVFLVNDNCTTIRRTGQLSKSPKQWKSKVKIKINTTCQTVCYIMNIEIKKKKNREPKCNMWIYVYKWELELACRVVECVQCLETWLEHIFFILICKRFKAPGHEINKRLHSVNASFRCSLTILTPEFLLKSSLTLIDWPF